MAATTAAKGNFFAKYFALAAGSWCLVEEPKSISARAEPALGEISRQKGVFAMTATRLRLVDEAKKSPLGNTRTAEAAPASDVRQKRGPGAQSEVVPKQPAPRPRPRAGKRASNLADVMRSPAVCCGLMDSLGHVAQLMWEHDVGLVVVVDGEGKPLHVVTDRDICMGAFTQGVSLWQSSVLSLLPAAVVVCSVDAGVVEARRLMQEHGVRRVVVVGADGKLAGVVGLGDLVREATITAPKTRTRGLTAAQLAQTLTAVYEDVPAPPERASR
jgi:CBS domain-containing protein